jgi:predicted AlkP superfamily phosphohydrolase/phosphomutase
VTFPPEKFPGVMLSGMCVPDLKGSQGTFCFCTTRAQDDGTRQGGVIIPFEKSGTNYRSYIPGPDNPLIDSAQNKNEEMRVPFEVRPKSADTAEILVGSERISLKVGEYSEWTSVQFKAGFGITAHGICRFYLKQLLPEVEVYVTPVNIDPKQPDLPISHPLTYSIYLAKLNGPYATLGLAEDTWALNEHALDDAAFLEQCYSNHNDREKQLFDALEKTTRGVCTCVFDITDRVQHMFWRYMEEDHPALQDSPAEAKLGNVIEQLYQRMDDLIGRVLTQLDSESMLMVVSDHGFKSFQRGINLNTWLRENGYLALKPGVDETGEWFQGVDWSRTRAYTMGLNGLFLNVKGREREGIVVPGAEADALKEELRQKLNGLADLENGKVGITGVFNSGNVYAGPYSINAPDLIIGYGDGYRASWDGVTGKVTHQIFEDNAKAWSGDHCIDPRLVPGVLFSNRKIQVEKPAIVDVAPTMLRLFGLQPPAHFDGKAWTVA